MSIQVHVFEDFHVHGASAPEWNQRYAQLSAGAMHSTLTEATTGGVHVFRKWMSEQVVQQGCLPPGRICFAVLNGPTARPPRVQNHELHENSLVVLRSGEDFTIQRPGGMELLAVTLPIEDFRRLVDEASWPRQALHLLGRQVLQVAPEALQRLRMLLEGLLARPAFHAGPSPSREDVAVPTALVASLRALLCDASHVQQTASSASSGFIVAECHRIVAQSEDAPPDIETLCRRLRTSRRRLQESFREVADTTPVHYLRGLRLNLVQRRLLSTSAAQLSVSQAATDQGFAHLSHFSERYKALFGELPSQTARSCRTRQNGFVIANSGGPSPATT
jgi:AraC family transcriptional regulator, ethanolamine operon transcriptional activator